MLIVSIKKLHGVFSPLRGLSQFHMDAVSRVKGEQKQYERKEDDMLMILYAVLSAIVVCVAVHLTISKSFRLGPPWPEDAEETKR